MAGDTGSQSQRIAAHIADVGGIPVRRALPTRERRMVGAWCFLDHAGPVDYPAGGGVQVGPHPHIGLQTFTWMIEGEILHSDSLGNRQPIRPGQVNVMTAGHGISHAEESPNERAGRNQLVQLWIALPDAERERAPMFQHCPELPRIDRDGFEVTVLVGDWLGATSPATVFSPLLGADLRADGAAAASLPLRSDFEHAVACLEGEIRIDTALA
jgi:redox-sensitive bicupin YhaK (pirin superfamily)